MNPYPPRFLALYHECDGPVVDLGCGPARPETVTMDRLTNVDLDVTGPDDVWEQVESGLAALYRPPDAGRVFATGCWAVARKIVP